MKRSSILICAIAALAFPNLLRSQTFGRNIGPADQFYKPKSKFTLNFGEKKEKGQIRWTTAPGGKQEFVKDDYVILEGDVKLYYQDIVLAADKVTYNLKTRDALAEGHVVLDQGPRRLSSDRAVYNLDSETGTLFNATAHFDPDVYFTGEKIEKLDEDTFRLTDGIFTSCDLDDPSWSFHLKSGLITMDDYARLKDLSFRAHKVPLFWTPYLVWPTKKDRSRGFLIPSPGFSNRYGAFLKMAYFIPYESWADATIRTQLYSKGDIAVGTDIRYRPSVLTKGDLLADLVRDKETSKTQWRYAYQHTQEQLPGGFRGVIDVKDFSDLDFFQTFERQFNINTISNIYSSAYLTKNEPTYSLNIRTDRRENFLGQGNSLVFEQLPGIDFRTYPNRVGASPLYFSLESSASHLRTSLGADYYRTDLSPTLSMQLRTPAWLSIKPQLTLRDTYYTSTLDPITQKITDNALNRSYAQAQVEVVGPSLSRIFNLNLGGFSKFKHVIEPRLRYIYTTDVTDQNEVIRFDTVDTPFLPLVRNLVEYSLTQRIIGKESGPNASARDIMSLTIKQSASLSGPFQTAGTFGTPGSGTDNSKFTPLTVTAHVNPYQTITIDASTTVGNVSHQVSQTSLSANLIGPASREYVNLTWFASYRQPGQAAGDSSQIRITGGGPIWKDRFRADTQLNFDADTGKFLEQRYIIGMFASCYSVAFEYRDFMQLRGLAEPLRNRDYQVSISLKNVGTFVDLRGSLDKFF